MRRLLAVLLVALCVPAVAHGAFSKGTWKGQGKVPGAKAASNRTVPLHAVVARGDCKKPDGLDSGGQQKTKQVKGLCLSFRGRSSYQVQCTFKSGVSLEQTVTPPSGYVVTRRGVYRAAERTDFTHPNSYQRITNSVRITLRGKRGTGVATYKAAQGGLPGESTCEGRMNIALKHR